jgi:hypothetical protein
MEYPQMPEVTLLNIGQTLSVPDGETILSAALAAAWTTRTAASPVVAGTANPASSMATSNFSITRASLCPPRSATMA